MTDAATIFAQTRSAIASVAYPARVSYTIVVSGLDGDVRKINHYRAILDTQRNDGLRRSALKKSPRPLRRTAWIFRSTRRYVGLCVAACTSR